MTTLLAVSAAVIAAAAAARSTWSPCGLSMLATITPLAERGRGHRFRTTAAWFVAGAVAGGVSLGLVLAVLALGVGAAAVPKGVVALIACGSCVVAAAADSGLGGFGLPFHRRQVNERWLDQFRPWVYGAGFGWQIGSGVVTYIKTSAVYLMLVLAALTGRPLVALGVCTLFGLVRGLAVLLGRGITSSAALAEFHQRFTAVGPLVLGAMVACEVGVASAFVVSLGWAVSGWVALMVGVALAASGAVVLTVRGVRRPAVTVPTGGAETASPSTPLGGSRSGRTA